MSFHSERILKLQQQLKVAKIGFTCMAGDCVISLSKAPVTYELASEVAEQLYAGYELIKELESQITYYNEKLEEV